jgi:hypothetical protein
MGAVGTVSTSSNPETIRPWLVDFTLTGLLARETGRKLVLDGFPINGTTAELRVLLANLRPEECAVLRDLLPHLATAARLFRRGNWAGGKALMARRVWVR